MKIGYLGPSGSFTHNVALKAFPNEDLLPLASITEVIKSYEMGLIDYAIVPVENSIEGSVHETLDYLFHQAAIEVVMEIIQHIKQQLMVVDDNRPIEKIFSHPQGLAQGKKYVSEHFPHASLEMTASTAYAARFVSEHADQPYAAIAPHAAAEEYGLTVIAQDIQEIDDNFTRFWVLGHSRAVIPLQASLTKASLALTLPDNLPGALYKAISVFAWRGLDLTKIESRPLKTVLGEYFFILDVNNDNPDLLNFALKELISLGIDYKILGLYQVYHL